jgi:hypothetical protein
VIPISGLSTTYDMTELLKRRHHLETTKAEESTTTESGLRDKCEKAWGDEQHEWEEVIRAVHCSFERVIQVLDEAIQHILLLLKLVPTSKVQGNIAATAKGSKMVDLGFGHDIEKGINPPKPGDLNFGSYLDQKLQGFKQEGSGRLKRWCEEKGLGLVFHDSAKHVNWSSYHTKDAYVNHHAAREIRASQRLRVILYMEYLLYSSSNAIFAMVRFAESKVEDGTMKKQRFIFPTLQTLIKWIKGLANGGDASPDIDQVDNMAGNVGTIYLGDSLRVCVFSELLVFFSDVF